MTANEAYKSANKNRLKEVLEKIEIVAEKGLFETHVEVKAWYERFKIKEKLEKLGYEVRPGILNLGGGVFADGYIISWVNAKKPIALS